LCDANDYALGAVLDQSKDKKHFAISYTSKTLTTPQLNYATTEKELLVVVFASESLDHIWWAPRSLSIQIMPLSNIS
jgi:hypothetical protein